MKRTNLRATRIFTLILALFAIGIAGQFLRSGATVTRAANADDAPTATKEWFGHGTPINDNWANNTNWLGIGGAGPGDDLVFPEGAALRRVNNNDFPVNTNFDSLTFTGSDYVVSGNQIFLESGITVNVPSGAGPVFNPNMILGPANFQVWNCFAGGITLNGVINLNGLDLRLANPGDFFFNGLINGSGSLTKNGSGTVRISSNSGGFGSTNINAGTLFLNGTLGTVNLNSGILRGNGTTGAIVATGAPANGILDPSGNAAGTSTATLNATAVTLAAASTLAININSASNFDRLNVNGQNVSLNGANLNVTFGNGFTSFPGQEFTIINETGAGIIFPNSQFAQGTSMTVNGRPFTITYTTSSVTLKDVSTPEDTPFDYDGDGKADISIYRPSNGDWYVQQSQAGLMGRRFGLSTDRIAPADYDGDGKTDIAVYRPSVGTWFVVNSSNNTVTFPVFGVAEDLPTPADYDGDGKGDISVFRPSSGTWFRQNSGNGSFFGFQFGQNGDKPTIGDFDGDAKADIGIWRPSNGDWYHVRSTNGSIFGERFGISTDKIVPADYDGDGKTDIAIWRPSNGTWHFKFSNTGSYTSFPFGVSTDIPAPGDYDGDGKADMCVFRPTEGNWFRRNSSNGSFSGFLFGTNGDRPTPSAFN